MLKPSHSWWISQDDKEEDWRRPRLGPGFRLPGEDQGVHHGPQEPLRSHPGYRGGNVLAPENPGQSGPPRSVEEWSEELLRQLSYAIKNQLQSPQLGSLLALRLFFMA